MLFNCLTCLTIMTRQQRRTWWMLMNYAKKKPDEIRGLPLSSPRSTWWNQPFAIQCKHLARSVVTWNESCHQHFFYPYLYIPYNILCIYRYTHIDIHVTYYMHAVSCGTISVSHSSRDKTGPPCWAHFRNFKDRRQTWQVFFWVTYWKKVGTYGNIWKHDNWW